MALAGRGLRPRGAVELWGRPERGLLHDPWRSVRRRELGIADARRLRMAGRTRMVGGMAVLTIADGSCSAQLQLVDLTSCATTGVDPLP